MEHVKRKKLKKETGVHAANEGSSKKVITDKEALQSYCVDEKVDKFVQFIGEDLLDTL